MYAVEFLTRIKNGIIEIPREYREYWRQRPEEEVRVIVLTSGTASLVQENEAVDIIDQLMANPLKVIDASPLNRNEIHERG